MKLDAAALVIGIEKYELDAIPEIKGALHDARTAVAWLRKIGVPDDRIHVHVNPIPAIGGTIETISAKDASYENIVDSMTVLSEGSGDKLFLFFSGHGFYVPGGGPIFLTQDYGPRPARVDRNLGMDSFIKWFLSWRYRDQFLFYDACQNVSSPEEVKSAVKPNELAITDALPIGIQTSLLVCYSAAPSQRAWSGNGEGVLVRHVLKQLEPKDLAGLPPDDERQAAVLYDWHTGTSRLEMREVFEKIIAPAITGEAALAGLVQTPYPHMHGRAATMGAAPIFNLATGPIADLQVSFSPGEAADAVERAVVTSTLPPRRLILPSAGHQLTNPVVVKAPAYVEFEASCRVERDSKWMTLDSPKRSTIEADSSEIVLTLGKNAPPTGEARSALRITIHDMDGDLHGPLSDYTVIAQSAGLDEAFPAGVSFEKHEYGPNIFFDADDPDSVANATTVASDWFEAIKSHLNGKNLSVSLSVAHEAAATVLPELQVKLSGEPRALAGFLANTNVISIFAIGDPDFIQTLAPASLPDARGVHLGSGAYRVEVGLPWGYWSKIVNLRDGETAVCTLPRQIGLPPLRNGRSDGLASTFYSGRYLGLAIAADMLGVELAVSQEETVRVEPISQTSLPEWDLLFSAYRPEEISVGRVRELVEFIDFADLKGLERDLMLLGLAYVALLHRDPRAMESALAKVDQLARSFDYRLLEGSRRALDNPNDANVEVSRIIELARHFEPFRVPPVLMRYNLVLLDEMFRARGDVTPRWNLDPNTISPFVALSPYALASKDSIIRAILETDFSQVQQVSEVAPDYA